MDLISNKVVLAASVPTPLTGSFVFALLRSLHSGLVHAISEPPAAPVLFALSSPAVGLAGLFVLISTMFAKELTSGDGSPCVFSCDAEKTSTSGGLVSEGTTVCLLIHIVSQLFSRFGSPLV